MLLRRVIEHVKAQQWTAVALDFVIVVAGILIAFQITEWNEARRERVRESDYLVRIVAELDRSIESIEHGVRRSKEREDFGRFLIASLDDPEIVRADPGRFIEAVAQAGYTFSPVVRAHTFEEIKSTGDLGIFRDKALLFDLSEFYTRVLEQLQWNYLREVKQTEYLKRSAGILTFEQLKLTNPDGIQDMPVADALAARDRMLRRPEFIQWLPTMTDRSDDTWTYGEWLETATALRARIRSTPGVSERLGTALVAP
jgi:hypothetical protein